MASDLSSTRPATKRTPKRSIARKLAALVTVAVATSAVTMSGVFMWQEIGRYAETKSRLLLGSAQVFASATARAAATGNQSAAYQAIKAIAHIPGFVYARVEARGRTLVVISGTTQLDGDRRIRARDVSSISPLALMSSRRIQVEAPIVDGGVAVGRLALAADSSDLADSLLASLRGAAIGAAAALLIGLLVASRLRKGFTRPVLELSEAIWRIRRSHDYADRVTAKSNDEVGLLIEGFNAMLEELSERDKSLAEHRRNLEKEVSDRTRDLRVAKDAAEMAAATKSDFLATMSHEIRTPMNGVMVMAELLAASDLPESQRRYAEVIAKSGQSLLAIINDILDFSKIESGKLALERIALDPAEIAEDVTSLFGERAREKGLDLVSYVSPATPRLVTGDPVRLNQVIGNLVNNALKFTETGSVILKVAPDPKDVSRLRFAVADTGIGMRASKLKEIFGAFSQADASTTRRFGGTGLGLAISKRLIEAMDGELDVKSAHGRGSTFSFSVPVGASETAERWPRARSAGATAVVAVKGDATRATLLRYLTEAGYTATAAQDGMVIAGDVVIADPQEFDYIRRSDDGHLLCLATFGDPAAHRMVQEGRADAMLSRPLRRSEIVTLLRRIGAGRKLGAENEKRGEPLREAFRRDGLRVLVADDTAINREVAIEALRQLGAMVATAENGVEAVAAMQSREFDVVLMDVSMPDVDGFEATRRIRRWEEAGGHARTPIVAVTAHVVGGAADAWRTVGMDAVLYKPYSVRSLSDCLATVAPAPRRKAAPTITGAAASPTFAPVIPDLGKFAGAPVLNEDKLRQMSFLGETGPSEFLQRVFGLYLKHGPAAIAEMRQAMENADAAGVRRAAHALKSMSLNLCADRVAACAEELERRANPRGPEIAKKDVDALEGALQQTCARIRALIEAADIAVAGPAARTA